MECLENFERICGEWMFNRSGGAYRRLTSEERGGFLEFCGERHLLPFACYFLSKTGSMPPENDPWREKLLKSYSRAAARELKRTAACRRTAAILRENGVDFIPLKGMFTAFRAYPAPALRPRSDIDVLIRNSDLKRVPEIFRGLGWRNVDERAHTLHISALAPPDGEMPLEAHFSIFRNGAGSEQNDALWQLAKRDGSGALALPAEIHLLHALDNALSDNWRFGLKPLFDSAMIAAKFSLDPEKLERYRFEFKINADPRLLFQAFPAVFGDAAPPRSREIPAEVLAAFRDLTYTRDAIKHNTYQSLVVSEYRNRPATGKLKFLFSRLFSPPETVRARYNLPPHAPFGLMRGYCADFFRKAAIFLKMNKLSPPPEIERHSANCRLVRNYLKIGK